MTATSQSDIETLDKLIKAKYGIRRINSLGEMIEDDLDFVSDVVYIQYSTKWDRLWTDYIAEYNPLWNVDGSTIETETRELEYNHTGTDTVNDSGKDTTAKTGTDTRTKTGEDTYSQTGTDTFVKSGNETVADGIYGFDSVNSVPSNQSTTTPNLTDTETKNLTDTTEYGSTDTNTLNLQDETTYGKQSRNTKNLKDTDEGTIVRETVRQGNIGVTMTQQLLTADRDYWNDIKSLFYDTVISDILSEITYKIY